MTICLTCFLLLETKSGERQKEWWGLCECSRGSCSFFAWVAFREASYLADDKCLCTLSCLRTPADFKPWQPAQPQPHNLRPSTSACPSAQQINDSLYSLWPVDTSATAAYPESLLSDTVWEVMLMCTDRWDLPGSVMSWGPSPRQRV